MGAAQIFVRGGASPKRAPDKEKKRPPHCEKGPIHGKKGAPPPHMGIF